MTGTDDPCPAIARVVARVRARTCAGSGRRASARARLASLAVLAVLAAGLLPVVAPAAPLALAPAAPAASTGAVQIRDDRGRTVALPAPPARIVTLVPSLAETVCALDACARLVGTDRYANWPPSVQGLPKLGGLDDASIEAVVALKPDLVLLSTAATRVAERLASLGVVTAALDTDDSADVGRNLERIATLLGDAGRGRAVWDATRARVAAAAARVPAGWRGRTVYFEVDPTPYAAGAASFIGETLQALGLRNVAPAALGAFPRLNPEFVVRADPDLLMVEAGGVAALSARPGWAGLRAWRERRVCALPRARYELVTRPGPRLGEAAEVLAGCLAGLPAPA